jgi:hypothetical protein
VRIAVVGVGERAEALLACGVEEVEPIGRAADGEGFALVAIRVGSGQRE